MERRLGRGLGSLLGGSIGPKDDLLKQEGALAPDREIPLVDIRPNPRQPRTVFDPEGLQELRDSIRTHGVLQPVVLRKVDSGYELIAGERRWRASRLAGLDKVPAIIRESVSDDDMLELALVENVQRRDLDAVEKARGFQLMVDQLSLTQAEVAAKVGLKRATVANHLRLLDLPDSVLEGVGAGLITMGHARALLAADGAEAQVALMEAVVRDGLSVRQTEARTQNKEVQICSPAPTDSSQVAVEVPAQEESWVTELQRRIQIALGTKVVIQNREGFKGRITLDYYGREDLDRLLEVLAPREEL